MKKILVLSILFSFLEANFDAWDSENKKSISTKTANKSFALTVVSLDNKGNFKKISKEICVRIKSKDFFSTWKKIFFSNEYKKEIFLKSPKITKKAKIEIKECDSDKIYESLDSFAIKPYKFELFIPKILKSQKEYFFKKAVKAVDFKGMVTSYQNSLKLKYEKLNRELKRDKNLSGVLKTSTLYFNNGKADLKISFDDTANIQIILEDSEFAKIDAKDTPLKEREIKTKITIFFKIDHFLLSFLSLPLIENNDKNYTYLSNDLNMSAKLRNLSFLIEAKGEQNKTLLNYKAPKDKYFANKIEIKREISINPSKDLLIEEQNTSFIKDIIFKDGKGIVNLKDICFNYKRDYKNPKNPFFVYGKDINISIKTNDNIFKEAKGEIFGNFYKKALFFYGKLETKDLKTDKNLSNHSAFVEIFCKKECDRYFQNFEENRINWFINRFDNQTFLKSLIAKISPVMKDSFSYFVGIKNIKRAQKGEIKFQIFTNKNIKSLSFIHIDIPKWLWFGRYIYSFSNDSSCANHPCFQYIYNPPFKKSFYLKSGEDKEKNFINDLNVSIEKKYLKVYR